MLDTSLYHSHKELYLVLLQLNSKGLEIFSSLIKNLYSDLVKIILLLLQKT